MIYVPIIWLIASLLVAPYRPGFLLGCALLAFQYDNLYNTTVVGPSIFVLFFCVIIFIALFQRRLFVLNNSDYLIMLFGVLYVLSALYSPEIGTGIKKSGSLILLCIGYYFAGRFLASNTVFRERYVFDLGISALILTLVFGYLSVGLQESSARLLLGGGSAVGFSQMIDIAAGFSLFYLVSASGRHAWAKQLVMLTLFVGVMTLLLFNATRGSVVSLVFAACVYLAALILQWKPGGRYLSRTMFLGFIMLGVFVILIQFSTQSGSLLYGLERLAMNFGPSGIQGDTSVTVRFLLFAKAMEMFAESPLFGLGVGSFTWNGFSSYPHNVFMELLAETGLITTAVFTLILTRTSWMGFRLFKYYLPEATIIAGLFFVLVAHQQLSFALWMARTMFFAMGAIVSLHVRLKYSQSPSTGPKPSAILSGELLPEEHVKSK